MNISVPEKAKVLTGFHLKMIAIITMFIDHATKAILYNCLIKKGVAPKYVIGTLTSTRLYNILRGIGRLAFPIFCFFLIEGFIHTRSRAKYLARLLLFGVISEIPFDLGLYESLWYPRHQNVMFELAMGLLLIWVWDALLQAEKIPEGFRLILQGAAAAVFLIAAQKLHLDYGYKGLALILVLYLLRFDRVTQCTAGALVIGIWEWPAVFAFPLLCLYNGKRGRRMKYFFYAAYPAHLALLALLSTVLKNRL